VIQRRPPPRDRAEEANATFKVDKTMTTQTKGKQTAGQLLVRSLVNQDVKFIFGIPGGKIMPTFDVLNDEGPKIIVCRHEQNAAFMAAAVGRLIGRPGVCLVTSGPGTSNLVTGAATATSEGDPMVAIGGVVGQPEALKQTHQTMDSVAIMKPVVKWKRGRAVTSAFLRMLTALNDKLCP
jgi:acetolactate synthase I/II/III large subunit